MPAPMKTQEFVKGELPYKILMALYENSRVSLRKIGRDLNISYHTVQETLKELEEKYNISYTLDLDKYKLGFAQGEMITIKFGTMPNIDFLKEKLNKEVFVQNAYLAEGDFDLLLHVVGVAPEDFQIWQWQLRVSFAEYNPVLRLATIGNEGIVGFLPLRNGLIKESTVISDAEKRVLMLLNEDSRMKMEDICKRSKLSANKVAYIIKKLVNAGIIKKFSVLTQNPDKKTFIAFLEKETMPKKEHDAVVSLFADELLKEDFREVVNDYGLIVEAHGYYDTFDICAFKDGEQLAKRGTQMIMKLSEKENRKIEKAMLTYLVVGRWPFHLENYGYYKNWLSSHKRESS